MTAIECIQSDFTGDEGQDHVSQQDYELQTLCGSVTESCEIKRGRAFFSSALEVVLETTSVDHSTVYVERAVMAPNIAEVDADRQLGRGTTAGYLQSGHLVPAQAGTSRRCASRVPESMFEDMLN